MPTASKNPLANVFALADDTEKYRLIGLSDGEPGSRKTSFWLGAPSPIAVFSMDKGLEGVVSRELREHADKQIFVKEYEWAPLRDVDMQQDAIILRDEFESDFELALKHARSIILDKETDFWSLYRYAEFGPTANDAPRNYPALNQRYRKMVNAAKGLDLNIGFIDGMKDEWGEKVNKKTGAAGAASTGKRIRSGFGELEGLVHVVLHHSGVGPADEGNAEPWNIQMGKARGPEGYKYAGKDIGDLTFQEVGLLIFPDSQIGDWE